MKKDLIVAGLGLHGPYKNVIGSTKRHIFFGLMAGISLTKSLDLFRDGESLMIPVMNKKPDDIEIVYPDVTPKAVKNEKNSFDFINVFSREFVESFSKEHKLKITYFENEKNNGINLAVLELDKNALGSEPEKIDTETPQLEAKEERNESDSPPDEKTDTQEEKVEEKPHVTNDKPKRITPKKA